MLLSRSRKILLLFLGLFVVVGAGAGYLFLQLTADPGIDLAQDPNAVEAYEASRKLKLFADARELKRRGFVRLSEVEINSFIGEQVLTNRVEGEGLALVKTSILLGSSNLTVVAWIEKPLFGISLPVVWQRRINLIPGEERPSFSLGAMQVGHLEIPPDWWPQAYDFFGAIDDFFQERLDWLNSIPSLQIAKNELSNTPELRLYTFVPQDIGTK